MSRVRRRRTLVGGIGIVATVGSATLLVPAAGIATGPFGSQSGSRSSAPTGTSTSTPAPAGRVRPGAPAHARRVARRAHGRAPRDLRSLRRRARRPAGGQRVPDLDDGRQRGRCVQRPRPGRHLQPRHQRVPRRLGRQRRPGRARPQRVRDLRPAPGRQRDPDRRRRLPDLVHGPARPGDRERQLLGLRPSVAVNSANGEYLVAWRGDDDVDGDVEIHARRLTVVVGSSAASSRSPRWVDRATPASPRLRRRRLQPRVERVPGRVLGHRQRRRARREPVRDLRPATPRRQPRPDRKRRLPHLAQRRRPRRVPAEGRDQPGQRRGAGRLGCRHAGRQQVRDLQRAPERVRCGPRRQRRRHAHLAGGARGRSGRGGVRGGRRPQGREVRVPRRLGRGHQDAAARRRRERGLRATCERGRHPTRKPAARLPARCGRQREHRRVRTSGARRRRRDRARALHLPRRGEHRRARGRPERGVRTPVGDALATAPAATTTHRHRRLRLRLRLRRTRVSRPRRSHRRRRRARPSR